MSFTITLSTVAMMLLYAVPGYLMTKAKLLREEAIAPLVTLLLYLCSPMQTMYTMQGVTYSAYMLKYLGIATVLSIGLVALMLGIVYACLRRRQDVVAFRIFTIASACGNVGFFGIPLLEALLPDYPQALAFSSVFSVTMNILMWTVGSFIITRDRKYMSARKILTNPTSIAMEIALVLFFARIEITGPVANAITMMGRMATPMCMLVLGIRLALIPVRRVFVSPLQYLAVGLKMVAFPLLALIVCRLLPVERDFARCIYIIACVPVASVVLSFSEMLGEGQDIAANVMLLSTMLSIVTIPVMMLLAR